MSENSQALSRRRQYLYGPERSIGMETAKRLQQEDHIFQNFQKGVERFNSKGAFETITARDFQRRPHSQTHPMRWDSSAQHSTHLHFGSDSDPLTSVVRSDYTAKPLTKFKLHIPEGLYDVHLADMAPRYIADKAFEHSTYHSHFDGTKSYGEWSSRMAKEGKKVGRRHKTTQYQKSTHFELGSDPDCLVTETSHCFSARQPPCSTAQSDQVEMDRSKSNVFRSGDYNVSDDTPKDHFVSVQKQDFPKYVPAAGISTTTKRGYSHVIPSSKDQPKTAISALRKLLIEKNSEEFQNPRDPAAINVQKAFLKYDKDRSGKISIEELKVVCSELGAPITEEEIAALLKECDKNDDGQVDYVEFIQFLTRHTSSGSGEDEFISTNRETYSSRTHRSEVAEDDEDNAFVGGQYQTKTHFQFGDEKGMCSSTYTQDFHPEANKLVTRRSTPPVLPLSKVMHELPVVDSSTTTSRSDFVRHNVAALEETRLTNLTTNREKHKRLAVVLDNSDRQKYKDHYTTSIMTASYGDPHQTTVPKLVKPDLQDFHHLESNRALAHPPKGPVVSEVKQQFVSPLKDTEECITKRRTALGERTSRIRDNKQTHFYLGFDDSKPLSEKMIEYRDRTPVDPKLPAAGIPNAPTKGYSIINHDSSDADVRTTDDVSSGLQNVLQQRNFLKNINPRDPLNINLRKAFLEYDKDLSGTISRGEVKSVCKKMQVAVSDEDLEEMIGRCDKNGEGQIDYHDFALHLSRKQQPSSDHHLASTNRTDFKHPKDQSLTAMQKLVIDQDGRRYVPLQPSHYFHLDSGKEHLLSTTMKDFIRPEENVA